MSGVRLFDHAEWPSELIDERVKPIDEKERALLDARLNKELVAEFKRIDAAYVKLKCNDEFIKSQNDIHHYVGLVRNFKTDVLGHSSFSTLDSSIQDLVIAVNKMLADEKNEQTEANVMQKKAELEKALAYAIEQRKLSLVHQAYNAWKYPPKSNSNLCPLL